jgi:phage shock protein E
MTAYTFKRSKSRLALVTFLAVATLLTVAAVVTTSCGSSSSTTSLSATTTVSTADTTSVPTTVEVGYVTVDVQTAYDALSADESAQLVDVREPAEWQETGVPVGATLIPLGELGQRAPTELAKDRPVYVICRSGNRSRVGAAALVDLGFTDVFNVDGGVTAWSAAGLPVEPYTP